jgi:hypothetical protein
MEFENLGYMAMMLMKAGRTAAKDMRAVALLEMMTAVKMQKRTMKTSGRVTQEILCGPCSSRMMTAVKMQRRTRKTPGSLSQEILC